MCLERLLGALLKRKGGCSSHGKGSKPTNGDYNSQKRENRRGMLVNRGVLTHEKGAGGERS